MGKNRKWLFIIMATLLLLAGCTYMPQQSAGEPTQSIALVPSGWQDEVQLASKVRSDNQHTAVRPNPYWASTIVENEDFVFYVTTQGVKQLNKETDERTLLHKSNLAYRIYVDENVLYIWEMQPYGPYGTLQKKGTILCMDLQTQAIQELWAFDTEFINRTIYEFVNEGAIYQNHLYLYESGPIGAPLIFSVDLRNTKNSKYWPGFSFDEEDTVVRDGAFVENKLFYIKTESDRDSGSFTQLIEQDLATEEHRIVWQTPEEEQGRTLMKGVVAYKGTVYAAICDAKKPSEIQLVTIDTGAGSLSSPVATVNSISADVDFIIENSGLYIGALSSDSYILYHYDENEKTIRQIFASSERLVSFRVVHNTLFYGSDQGVAHVPLEK